MAMVLSEEQKLLRESARDFLREQAPIGQLRTLRDGADPDGFSRDLWRRMVEMGWAGIVIAEQHGGLDFGFEGLCLVLEEAGYTLAASPLVATVLCGSAALSQGGTDAQKAAVLPKLAAGEMLLALCVDEGAHHDPSRIAMTAEKTPGGYRLGGRKQLVLDGHVADRLVVAARTAGVPGDVHGITLFLVDAHEVGVTIQRTRMVDSRNAAQVGFDGVEISADAVLGEVDAGFALLDSVLDRGRIGLACEMLGSAQASFDMTLAYLKERTQFGQAIGRFQALQHRAAMMFAELEILRSVTLEAASAVDSAPESVPLLASLAKARACDVFHLIAREAIQMHGGIGMTDEHDIGFFLKRCAVAEATFGGAAFHRARTAQLEGY